MEQPLASPRSDKITKSLSSLDPVWQLTNDNRQIMCIMRCTKLKRHNKNYLVSLKMIGRLLYFFQIEKSEKQGSEKKSFILLCYYLKRFKLTFTLHSTEAIPNIP